MYSTRKKAHSPLLWRNPIGFAILGFVLIGVVLAILELTNTTHLLHKPKTTSSTIPAASSNSSGSSNTENNGQSTPPSSSNSTPAPSTETPKSPGTPSSLLDPNGTLVSNHRPNLSGSPTNRQEQSACNTTPGATCSIIFTKDGITKTLEAKQADSNGAVIWNWDVKTAGFTVGSWKITAVATLKGQTKSASDALNLEIQP